VQKHAGGSEVVEEVELRMAELLTERGVHGDKVVLAADVAYLKSQLGEPGDFDDETGTETTEAPTESEETAGKKLFRDTEHGMIAVVAAGLASYLNIDVIIVRLLFIALTFFGGSGVLLYVILWLLVPEAKTSSERLQMKGLAVNVENIKEVIARADVPGATRRASRAVGAVAVTLMHIILYIVGLVFVIGGVSIVIASAVLTIYGLLGGAQIGTTNIFPVGSEQITVLVCGFVILALIAGLLAATGVTLVRRKWVMPGWVVAAVVGVFIVASSVGVGFGFDVAPAVRDRYQSLQHTQVYSFGAVNKVRILGGSTVYYSVIPGDKPSVEVHTYNGLASKHLISVTADASGVVTIDTTKLPEHAGCRLVCPFGDRQATILISLPSMSQASIEAPASAPLQFDNGVDYVVTDVDSGNAILATPPIPAAPTAPTASGSL